MTPEPSLPQAMPYRTLATRIIALGVLTSLFLWILACKMGKDDVTDFKAPGQLPVEHPENASPPPTDADYIALPPAQQEVSSPQGQYVFVLSTPDNWASKQAVGELFEVPDGRRQSLWTRILPHEYGPRYVLVSDQGQVLLLDEWINVASRQAVMVLSRENILVAQHHFDAMQALLNVPRASIVAQASSGWWITSPPTLNSADETARVETAGKVLMINLEDGELSVARNLE